MRKDGYKAHSAKKGYPHGNVKQSKLNSGGDMKPKGSGGHKKAKSY